MLMRNFLPIVFLLITCAVQAQHALTQWRLGARLGLLQTRLTPRDGLQVSGEDLFQAHFGSPQSRPGLSFEAFALVDKAGALDFRLGLGFAK